MMGGRVEAIEDVPAGDICKGRYLADSPSKSIFMPTLKNNLINMTAPGLPAHPSLLCNSSFHPLSSHPKVR